MIALPAIDLGFTGTRRGMTEAQRLTFRRLIEAHPQIERFHHGDCVGADAQAHETVRALASDVEIHVHPPTYGRYRAWTDGDVLHERLPYLDRNHVIVETSNAVVATPAQDREVTRSGTWATVRYARRRERVVVLILPDGRITR